MSELTKKEEKKKQQEKLRRRSPNGLLQATWWRQQHRVNDGSDPIARQVSKLLTKERDY